MASEIYLQRAAFKRMTFVNPMFAISSVVMHDWTAKSQVCKQRHVAGHSISLRQSLQAKQPNQLSKKHSANPNGTSSSSNIPSSSTAAAVTASLSSSAAGAGLTVVIEKGHMNQQEMSHARAQKHVCMGKEGNLGLALAGRRGLMSAMMMTETSNKKLAFDHVFIRSPV